MLKIDLIHPIMTIEPTRANFKKSQQLQIANTEYRKLNELYQKLQERLFFVFLAVGGTVGLLATNKILENADMGQLCGGAMLTGLALALVGHSLPPRVIVSALASHRANRIRNNF
jgi:hypothetical protein